MHIGLEDCTSGVSLRPGEKLLSRESRFRSVQEGVYQPAQTWTLFACLLFPL